MDGCVYRSQFDLCEKNKEEDEKLGIRRWCDFEGCNDKHPSNADCIRQMSDEELAEFCFRITDDVASYYGGDGYESKYPVASKGWLDWLKQEANDVGQ